jgi:hypothetical protein
MFKPELTFLELISKSWFYKAGHPWTLFSGLFSAFIFLAIAPGNGISGSFR